MNYGVDNTYSSLYPVLNGNNPDDSYSQLPYEKGFQFLTYLETLFPSEQDFQNLLRKYFKVFSLQSIEYQQFQDFFNDYVANNFGNATEIIKAVDWVAWVEKPGANPPEWKVSFATEQAAEFEKLADDYIAL